MRRFLFQSLATAIGVVCFCALVWGGEQDSAKPKPLKVRVPYAADEQPGQEELMRSIRARRPGGKLLNLDRMLLNSPPLASGWNSMIGAVRGQLEVSPKLRELAIMAIAVLNGAGYEYDQHQPEFLLAGGTPEQLASLAEVRSACDNTKLFDETERVTLLLAYEMTRNVSVADSTVTRLRALIPDRQVVELVGTIAAYNMVSRFLVALGIEME